jgi:hypothetical protein
MFRFIENKNSRHREEILKRIKNLDASGNGPSRLIACVRNWSAVTGQADIARAATSALSARVESPERKEIAPDQ